MATFDEDFYVARFEIFQIFKGIKSLWENQTTPALQKQIKKLDIIFRFDFIHFEIAILLKFPINHSISIRATNCPPIKLHQNTIKPSTTYKLFPSSYQLHSHNHFMVIEFLLLSSLFIFLRNACRRLFWCGFLATPFMIYIWFQINRTVQ